MRRPLLLVLACLASPAVAGQQTPLRLLNAAELAGPESYPDASRRAEEEGTVFVLAEVDATGRVTRCDIAESSGFPTLDAGTCAVFMAKARLTPARDARGRPVKAVARQGFRWRLQNHSPSERARLVLERVAVAPGLSAEGLDVVRAEVAAWGGGLVPPDKVWLIELTMLQRRFNAALAVEAPDQPGVEHAAAALVAGNDELVRVFAASLNRMVERLVPADRAAVGRAMATGIDDVMRNEALAQPARKAKFTAEQETAIERAALSAGAADAVRARWRYEALAATGAAANRATRDYWKAVADRPDDAGRRAEALDAVSAVVREQGRGMVAMLRHASAGLTAEERRRWFAPAPTPAGSR